MLSWAALGWAGWAGLGCAGLAGLSCAGLAGLGCAKKTAPRKRPGLAGLVGLDWAGWAQLRWAGWAGLRQGNCTKKTAWLGWAGWAGLGWLGCAGLAELREGNCTRTLQQRNCTKESAPRTLQQRSCAKEAAARELQALVSRDPFGNFFRRSKNPYDCVTFGEKSHPRQEHDHDDNKFCELRPHPISTHSQLAFGLGVSFTQLCILLYVLQQNINTLPIRILHT